MVREQGHARPPPAERPARRPRATTKLDGQKIRIFDGKVVPVVV